MSKIILFKFPSKTRPQKFTKALKSITDNLAHPEDARFVFTLDSDDPKLNEYNEILDGLGEIDYACQIGTSTNKINAVNRDLKEASELFPDWEILVCMSDDMEFIVYGFDEIIRNGFYKKDLVLHFPDQNQGSNCMTLSIMDRTYFERTGKIYNDEYTSVECDLEEQEVAQMLGCYRFMEGQRIFNHNHPSFGQSDYDQQYRLTEAYDVHEKDKATRQRRKANNYNLYKTETGWDTRPPELIPEMTTKQKTILILRKAMEDIENL